MKNLKDVRNNYRTTVNVTVNDNVRYITVYQVRALNILGDKVFIDCYLDLNDAKKRVKSINTNFRHIYGVPYVFELKVLCSSHESVKCYDD